MAASDASAGGLTLVTESQPDCVIVHCRGRLMSDGAALLRATVKGLMDSPRRIVLDLTDVTQTDSLGLGAIASLYVSSRTAGCQLELVNLGAQLRKLFSMTNLLSLFECAGDDTIRIP